MKQAVKKNPHGADNFLHSDMFEVPLMDLYICVLVQAVFWLVPFHPAWRGGPAVVLWNRCVDLFSVSLSLLR